MLNRWHGAPWPVSVVAAAVVLVLGYGTVVHPVLLVVNGFNQHLDLPGWLRTYFLLLTIVDPLAIMALLRRTRAGDSALSTSGSRSHALPASLDPTFTGLDAFLA